MPQAGRWRLELTALPGVIPAMHNALRLVLLVWLIAFLSQGCDRQDSPTASESAPGAITGRERLGWDQRAPSAAELAQYYYVLYVDNTPVGLPDATCGAPAGSPPTAACTSPLPPLRPGAHTLELGTRIKLGGTVLESERSAPLVVTVTGSGTAGAVSEGALAWAPGRTARQPYTVEVVVGGLDRPSALARLPDGRLLIAEARGRIRLADAGTLNPQPALELDDIAAEGDGRLSLAAAPDFATSHRVYVTYASRDASGAVTGHVVRYREHGGMLGEPAVLLDGLPVEAGTPRLRIGADGAIYIAAGARNASDADSLGSYAGKVLRFTPDGAAPNDNPVRGSPVFSIGYAGRLDLAWEPAGRALWHVGTDAAGVSIGLTVSGRRGQDVLRIEGATSADAAFHSGDIPAAWRGSLLIASPDQECLYHVTGLSGMRPAPVFEKVLAGRYGRIVAVLSAEDGFYFATGNGGTDAAGQPADAVYRVRDRTEQR